MKNKKQTQQINEGSVLNKKDIIKGAWRYIFFHQTGQNYERMQGLAFGHVLQEPLRKIYKDDEEYRQALKRHTQYYNSNPNLGALVPGVVLALEEGRAKDPSIDEDLIVNTKTALMGPLAGIGDPLIGSVYGSIVASLAIGLSLPGGSILGPIFYLVLRAGVQVAIKYACFTKGYKLGVNAVKHLTSGITDTISMALSIIGLFTVGGITATTVSVPIKWEYVSGETVISMSEMLDKIMPGILPLLLTVGIWYLYSKKKWSIVKALLLLIGGVFVMVALGIM